MILYHPQRDGRALQYALKPLSQMHTSQPLAKIKCIIFFITLISDTSSAWRFYIKWIWRAWEGVTASSVHPMHQPETAVLPGTVAASWLHVRMWYLCIKPPCVLWSFFRWNLDLWCFHRSSGDAINGHTTTHPTEPMYSTGPMQPLQLCSSRKTPEVSGQRHSVYREGL